MRISTLVKIVSGLLLLIAGVFAVFYFSHVKTVQTKSNTAGTHRAKLLRYSGIDVNFRLLVDGKDVYWSPDFAPVDDDFREQLVWDRTGRVVVFEVAGQRLFAYDAEQKRPLGDPEILAVEYIPFAEFHYEGRLPNGGK
ncbi:MAG: hypothetical protein JSS81_07780 [Acidobacteria bacterium]|nr:hypothetical protein [Acidobacteriota bacterium]